MVDSLRAASRICVSCGWVHWSRWARRSAAAADSEHRAGGLGIVSDLRQGACATITVSLKSGETIEVQTQTSLAGCSTKVTPVLLGDLDASLSTVDGKGPLVLSGTVDGEPWIGSASWRPTVSAWCVIFKAKEGAYREGDTFHLASGLVVSVSSGFGWIDLDESEFLPFRDGDDLCLNELGQAIRANVWNAM